ncbi:MAG TPA: translation elongation factor Ts [Actinobacteria bacterium]|nr:translation elongation factor Ts [Actinomycetota bacterium]
MPVSTAEIQELRKKTGAGMMDSKKALVEAKGDLEKAVVILREKGLADLSKRAGREAKEGVVDAYIHANGKIGVLVEVNSETDFVAKNDKFKEFAHDLALHIAAADPKYVSIEDVPEDETKKEKELYKKQAKTEGKPENIVDKIAEGKLAKYYEQIVLLEQPFVKNPDQKIKDYLGSIAGSLGENIKISRFVRMQLGLGQE